MQLQKFDSPQKLRQVVLPHLLKHEAENNLTLGILANMAAGEYLEKPPYLGLVVDQGEPRLLILRTPPFPVLISYQEPPPEEEAIQLAIQDILKSFRGDLAGITGSKNLTSRMVEYWKKSTGGWARVKMAMRIYKLEHVTPVKNVAGKMRPAEKMDQDLLLRWYRGFDQDAANGEQKDHQIEDQVNRYLEADPDLRGLMLWEVDGKPVSMAGYTGPTPNGIRIGAVYTPPDQRNNGYASACVAGLSQQLLDRGFKFCFLFTDLLNPTSNQIYQQVGYEPVSDVDSYEFKSGDK